MQSYASALCPGRGSRACVLVPVVLFVGLIILILFFGGAARPSKGSKAPETHHAKSPLVPVCIGLEGSFGGSTSIGDLNGDTDADLLITGRTGFQQVHTRVYFGNGAGGFDRVDFGFDGTGPSPTEIGDLNSDGNPDLLIGTNLYLGDGTGHFRKAETDLPPVGDHGSTSIGDVNNDGDLDLLITGQRVSNTPSAETELMARVYLGDGTGGFTLSKVGLTHVSFGSTSIGDVNGDGNPDLLVTGDTDLSPSMNPTTTLYLGDGDGGFVEAQAGLTDVSHNGSTSIADVNGDDHPDLLITGLREDSKPSSTLYLGDGKGNFTKADADLVPVSFGATTIGDVDGDGNLDLLLTGRTTDRRPTTRLYFGRGDGTFELESTKLTEVAGSSAEMGDIDRDGRPDLVIRGRTANQTPVSTVYLTSPSKSPGTEISTLEADERGDGIHLSWRADCEIGSNGYEVQRRAGRASRWQRVGFVRSKVESKAISSTLSYQFSDANLPYAADSLFYRLRPTGTEGTADPTEAVVVQRGVSTVQFPPPYPNPAHSGATVRYAVPRGQDVTLHLYDTLGRRVRTLVQNGKGGRGQVRIGFSGLASGLYFLRLQSGPTVRSKRLTVAR